jgi:hypothetical protein
MIEEDFMRALAADQGPNHSPSGVKHAAFQAQVKALAAGRDDVGFPVCSLAISGPQAMIGA